MRRPNRSLHRSVWRFDVVNVCFGALLFRGAEIRQIPGVVRQFPSLARDKSVSVFPVRWTMEILWDNGPREETGGLFGTLSIASFADSRDNRRSTRSDSSAASNFPINHRR